MLFSSFFPPLFSEKCENLLCIEHYNINTFATINVSLLSDVVLVLYPTLYKRNTFTVLKYIVYSDKQVLAAIIMKIQSTTHFI